MNLYKDYFDLIIVRCYGCTRRRQTFLCYRLPATTKLHDPFEKSRGATRVVFYIRSLQILKQTGYSKRPISTRMRKEQPSTADTGHLGLVDILEVGNPGSRDCYLAVLDIRDIPDYRPVERDAPDTPRDRRAGEALRIQVHPHSLVLVADLRSRVPKVLAHHTLDLAGVLVLHTAVLHMVERHTDHVTEAVVLGSHRERLAGVAHGRLAVEKAHYTSARHLGFEGSRGFHH